MRLRNFLNEGILKVSIGSAKKILVALKSEIINDPSNVMDILNNAFEKENIKFIESAETKNTTISIQKGFANATKNRIEIFLNVKIFLKTVTDSSTYDRFIHDTLSYLVHEKTHIKQFSKMKVIKNSTLEISDDPHELQALANQTVFEIINNGEDDIWDILDSLKRGEDVQSEVYVRAKKELTKKGMQQYLKYIYMYISDIIK